MQQQDCQSGHKYYLTSEGGNPRLQANTVVIYKKYSGAGMGYFLTLEGSEHEVNYSRVEPLSTKLSAVQLYSYSLL